MKKFVLIIALVSALVSVSFAASRDYSLPPQEGVKTLDDLYTKCAEVQDEFSALMQSLSQRRKFTGQLTGSRQKAISFTSMTDGGSINTLTVTVITIHLSGSRTG